MILEICRDSRRAARLQIRRRGHHETRQGREPSPDTVFAIFSLTLGKFLTSGNLSVLVFNMSLLGILGCGMAVVVIGRGVDLSMVAELAVVSACLVQLLANGFPMEVAIPITIVLALAMDASRRYSRNIVNADTLRVSTLSGAYWSPWPPASRSLPIVFRPPIKQERFSLRFEHKSTPRLAPGNQCRTGSSKRNAGRTIDCSFARLGFVRATTLSP